MTMLELPSELEFLRAILADRNEQYQSADWLLSGFKEEQWRGRFLDYANIEIDFRVSLDDGSFLTAPKNAALLDAFKRWICVQTHFDATGGKVLAAHVSYQRVCRTLHLIDYFLLNAAHFKLSTYGLELLTENDITQLLSCLASVNDTAISVYCWPTLLRNYLLSQTANFPPEMVVAVVTEFPPLGDLNFCADEAMLNLSDREIIQARSWLWINGYYKNSTERSEYRYGPSTQKLSQKIYPNTLWGKYKKPIPAELVLDPMEKYYREYQPVPVRNLVDSRATERVIAGYQSVLRRLGLLAEMNRSIPISSLRILDNESVIQNLNLKPLERTRTLPQGIVFATLRNSIEFALEYGDDIIASALAIFARANAKNMSCEIYCRQHRIEPLLSEKLRSMGVRTWSLKEEMTFIECNPNRQGVQRAGRSEYFRRMRQNEGMLQLILVLFGAVQLCVGTLMARRQGELADLVAKQCLDTNETHLIFFNRKSGVLNCREKEARPIPPVAVKLIKLIEQFQDGLLKLGVIRSHTHLFCAPTTDGKGLVKLSPSMYNKSIDHFCDYFQTPVNSSGERFYFRQHQLRRFFAMLFFWGGSFGKMDTLRWFLGHTDISHLYHYITESTPGDVLRSVQAQFACEQALLGTDESASLSELLERRFGTKEFSVLDSVELDEYIEELIANGSVKVEPEFLDTQDGQSYRILIKVSPVNTK